jgi:hypothetical protein
MKGVPKDILADLAKVASVLEDAEPVAKAQPNEEDDPDTHDGPWDGTTEEEDPHAKTVTTVRKAGTGRGTKVVGLPDEEKETPEEEEAAQAAGRGAGVKKTLAKRLIDYLAGKAEEAEPQITTARKGSGPSRDDVMKLVNEAVSPMRNDIKAIAEALPSLTKSVQEIRQRKGLRTSVLGQETQEEVPQTRRLRKAFGEGMFDDVMRPIVIQAKLARAAAEVRQELEQGEDETA